MLNRLWVAPFVSLLAGSAFAQEPAWTFRSEFAQSVSAQFISSDDSMLLYESRLGDRTTSSKAEIRLLSADGNVLFAADMPYPHRASEFDFLLVDRWHVALPIGSPMRIGLVPDEPSPSPVAQAFLSWLEASGSHAQTTGFRASTNPYVDLSCAIGADGSIAVWRTTGEVYFEVSPPGTIATDYFAPLEVFCLETDGQAYAAVQLVNQRMSSPHRSWVYVFEPGANTPTAELELLHEGVSYLLNGSVAAPDVLLGLDAVDPTQLDRMWITARIALVEGQWRIEQSRIDHWPRRRHFSIKRVEDLLLSFDDTGEIVSVPWPQATQTVAYAQRPLGNRELNWQGPYDVSPSGRLWLFIHRDDAAVRVTPARRAPDELRR